MPRRVSAPAPDAMCDLQQVSMRNRHGPRRQRTRPRPVSYPLSATTKGSTASPCAAARKSTASGSCSASCRTSRSSPATGTRRSTTAAPDASPFENCGSYREMGRGGRSQHDPVASQRHGGSDRAEQGLFLQPQRPASAAARSAVCCMLLLGGMPTPPTAASPWQLPISSGRSFPRQPGWPPTAPRPRTLP